MSRNDTYYVFFSPQNDKKHRYRILLSGVETETYVTKHDIMKILTISQFKDFVKELGIFEVSKRILDPYLKDEPQQDERKRWKPL